MFTQCEVIVWRTGRNGDAQVYYACLRPRCGLGQSVNVVSGSKLGGPASARYGWFVD